MSSSIQVIENGLYKAPWLQQQVVSVCVHPKQRRKRSLSSGAVSSR